MYTLRLFVRMIHVILYVQEADDNGFRRWCELGTHMKFPKNMLHRATWNCVHIDAVKMRELLLLPGIQILQSSS